MATRETSKSGAAGRGRSASPRPERNTSAEGAYRKDRLPKKNQAAIKDEDGGCKAENSQAPWSIMSSSSNVASSSSSTKALVI
jgi:hypothetical protein